MEEKANNAIIFEQGKRFSQSVLYQLQRDFFDKEGLNAWVRQVPFYITSNPFIANCYTEVVIALIQDWIKIHPSAIKHTFYIMELGTGSGQFSYYFVKNITALLLKLDLQDIKICYVMSDFTQSNITGWENHPDLKPFIEQGILDFAIYNMEKQTPIELIKRNIALDTTTLINPLIVFANYIFDTVSQDAFSLQKDHCYELIPVLSTPENNLSQNRPLDFKKITVNYHQNKINLPYYDEEDLDNILTEYQRTLTETALLFPIGSLRAIQFLKTLTDNNLFLIATDKGHTTLEALNNIDHPAIKFHGSFSVMVNFHAIAQYFKNTGGSAALQNPRNGIKTAVFSSRTQLESMPRTRVAIEKYIDGYSPSDFFVLFEKIYDSYKDDSLETIASYLQMSGWDPYIYTRLAERIHVLLDNANNETLEFLAHNMSKIADNYYYMPTNKCVLFEIGTFFYAIKQYEEAMKYYTLSQSYVGNNFGVFYNLALCQYYLGYFNAALTNFKDALQQEPSSKDTEAWITFLQQPG